MGNELFQLNERTTSEYTTRSESQFSSGIKRNIRSVVSKIEPEAYDDFLAFGRESKPESPKTIPLYGDVADNRPDEDVTISFNVAGSSFAQPLHYDVGLAGKSNIVLKENGTSDKYQKGESNKEYIYDDNGTPVKLKGEEVKKFVENKLTETYGKKVVFRKKIRGELRSVSYDDIRVKRNGNSIHEYSISGPRVDILWSKNVGAFNAGDYSIEKTRNNICAIGIEHLTALMGDEKFMKGHGKINFDFTGHSRGGVGAVQGAMMLKHIVETEYPMLKDRVQFSVLLYDPVPGPKSRISSNVNQSINLREQTQEMKQEKMAAFGDKDKAVVVYSMGCNHAHFFTPMKVLGADTTILTGESHDEGLKDVEMQFGKKTRQAYVNVKTREAYRGDGLREMPKGIFISDENKLLVPMDDMSKLESIVREAQPEANDRTRRILEVCADINVRNGGAPSLDVIARGFKAHDPFYVYSSDEFRDMRKQFEQLTDMISAGGFTYEELLETQNKLRDNAMEYLQSKAGKEPFSNRTQGRMNVAKNIIRFLDDSRDNVMSAYLTEDLEKKPENIDFREAFISNSNESYIQNKLFLADVCGRYLDGKPVESDLFRDTIVGLMADRYFLQNIGKYTNEKSSNITNKLNALLGEGEFSLFKTFRESKIVKKICNNMPKEELAKIFTSPKNADKVLDSLINSAVHEKFLEVSKANIKKSVQPELNKHEEPVMA